MSEGNIYLIVRVADLKPVTVWAISGGFVRRALAVFASEEKAQAFIDEVNFGLDDPPEICVREYSQSQLDGWLSSLCNDGVEYLWRNPEHAEVVDGYYSDKMMNSMEYLRHHVFTMKASIPKVILYRGKPMENLTIPLSD